MSMSVINDQILNKVDLKILVTGFSGWLGQFVIRSIPDKFEGLETKVYLAYHQQLPSLELLGNDKKYITVFMDIENSQSLDTTIGEILPDIIVHLAAIPSPASCERDFERASKVNCPSFFIDAVQKYVPNCLFIFSSTDLVYDGECPPYLSSDCPEPKSSYGRTKLSFESLVLGLKFGIVLRLSNMIGPSFAFWRYGTKFLEWVMICCEKRECIGLRSDEIRSFVDVEDVVIVILNAIKKHLSGMAIRGIYNVGGPRGLTRLELGRLVAAASNVPFLVDLNPNNYDSVGVSTHAECDMTHSSVWKVYEAFNADAVCATGIPNPRDVTMISSLTEETFDMKFSDMETSVIKYVTKL